jgi:hypothetical protein
MRGKLKWTNAGIAMWQYRVRVVSGMAGDRCDDRYLGAAD